MAEPNEVTEPKILSLGNQMNYRAVNTDKKYLKELDDLRRDQRKDILDVLSAENPSISGKDYTPHGGTTTFTATSMNIADGIDGLFNQVIEYAKNHGATNVLVQNLDVQEGKVMHPMSINAYLLREA